MLARPLGAQSAHVWLQTTALTAGARLSTAASHTPTAKQLPEIAWLALLVPIDGVELDFDTMYRRIQWTYTSSVRRL